MNVPTPAAVSDEELRALIVLMSLKHAGPRRIRALLAGCSAVEAVQALHRRERPTEPSSGDLINIPPGVWTAWFDDVRPKAESVDLEAHRSDGGQILHPGHVAWPFRDDPDPPVLLFVRGDLGLLAEPRRRVAIVGTRRCTSIGRQVADGLGADLATAGLVVVSGLALGVDAAAHRGALSVGGPVIGVVASGLDVVYPASNRALWNAVADAGLLVSEVPMGQRPTKWRFPARNRLIAALSSLVVVVESHARGGALSTVDEAAERGIAVAVVPGSTLSPASDGTNALLVEGAPPIRHAADVLDLLGVAPGTVGIVGGAPSDPSARPRPAIQLAMPLDPTANPERLVLDALAAGPVHLDRLIELLGVAPPAAVTVLDQLIDRGQVSMTGHVLEIVDGSIDPGSAGPVR